MCFLQLNKCAEALNTCAEGLHTYSEGVRTYSEAYYTTRIRYYATRIRTDNRAPTPHAPKHQQQGNALLLYNHSTTSDGSYSRGDNDIL